MTYWRQRKSIYGILWLAGMLSCGVILVAGIPSGTLQGGGERKGQAPRNNGLFLNSLRRIGS